jgi:hypothetical protein
LALIAAEANAVAPRPLFNRSRLFINRPSLVSPLLMIKPELLDLIRYSEPGGG